MMIYMIILMRMVPKRQIAFIHQCTMPKMGTMNDKWKGVVASGAKKEGEQYDYTVEIRHETLANQRRT